MSTRAKLNWVGVNSIEVHTIFELFGTQPGWLLAIGVIAVAGLLLKILKKAITLLVLGGVSMPYWLQFVGSESFILGSLNLGFYAIFTIAALAGLFLPGSFRDSKGVLRKLLGLGLMLGFIATSCAIMFNALPAEFNKGYIFAALLGISIGALGITLFRALYAAIPAIFWAGATCTLVLMLSPSIYKDLPGVTSNLNVDNIDIESIVAIKNQANLSRLIEKGTSVFSLLSTTAHN